jgi:hypothetical protein
MADVPEKPAKDEDEVHRKFREALERKAAARTGSRGPGQRGGSSGVGPASNDKSTRQFRRKSGG